MKPFPMEWQRQVFSWCRERYCNPRHCNSHHRRHHWDSRRTDPAWRHRWTAPGLPEAL